MEFIKSLFLCVALLSLSHGYQNQNAILDNKVMRLRRYHEPEKAPEVNKKISGYMKSTAKPAMQNDSPKLNLRLNANWVKKNPTVFKNQPKNKVFSLASSTTRLPLHSYASDNNNNARMMQPQQDQVPPLALKEATNKTQTELPVITKPKVENLTNDKVISTNDEQTNTNDPKPEGLSLVEERSEENVIDKMKELNYNKITEDRSVPIPKLITKIPIIKSYKYGNESNVEIPNLFPLEIESQKAPTAAKTQNSTKEQKSGYSEVLKNLSNITEKISLVKIKPFVSVDEENKDNPTKKNTNSYPYPQNINIEIMNIIPTNGMMSTVAPNKTNEITVAGIVITSPSDKGNILMHAKTLENQRKSEPCSNIVTEKRNLEEIFGQTSNSYMPGYFDNEDSSQSWCVENKSVEYSEHTKLPNDIEQFNQGTVKPDYTYVTPYLHYACQNQMPWNAFTERNFNYNQGNNQQISDPKYWNDRIWKYSTNTQRYVRNMKNDPFKKDDDFNNVNEIEEISNLAPIYNNVVSDNYYYNQNSPVIYPYYQYPNYKIYR